MKINEIKLRFFRNYDNLTVDTTSKLNIFIGNNAQGKTNLLESIYYLSTTQSFRDVKEIELVKENEAFSQIEVLFENDSNRSNTLKSIIHQEGKSFYLNNNILTKTSDVIGIINTILFSPTDLNLILSVPKVRRRFMDIEIGKINKKYILELRNYHKVLKDRNLYLKENSIDFNYLGILTGQLVDYSIYIYEERKKFIDYINSNINLVLNKISTINERVSIKYLSINCNKEELLVKYDQQLEKDILFKKTNIGIHKDEFEVYIDNKLVSSYASQGQIRLIVLAIKLTLIDYVKDNANYLPILLLDDVLSELDVTNQSKLFSYIDKDIQTFITTTDINDLVKMQNKDYTIYTIDSGNIVNMRGFTNE